MIIACPSCATQHNLPNDDFVSDGSIIKCDSCGHSWLEARAVEVIDITATNRQENHPHHFPPENLPTIPQAPDAEMEAARIAKAVKQAERKKQEAERIRRKKIRGWMTFAACICAPVAVAALFPETVVRTLPGSIAIYEKLGRNVNVRGFEIANITHQYLMANGTRVLAIRGEIRNVSGRAKTIPSLHFSLRSKNGKPLYQWNLNGVSKRPLAANASTTFLTRIAEPPKSADDFQIRFAQADEIAKTASYENSTNKRSSN